MSTLYVNTFVDAHVHILEDTFLNSLLNPRVNALVDCIFVNPRVGTFVDALPNM